MQQRRKAGPRYRREPASRHFCAFSRNTTRPMVAQRCARIRPHLSSADDNFYSTSWLAARAYAATNLLDEMRRPSTCLIGASHSERTPFSGVTRLRLGHGIDLDANTEQSRFPAGLVPAPYVRHASFDDAVERISSRLAESFAEITSAFPGRTSAALSGGFDSRLIVASLLANGERPRLFVYGADESEDVRIARQIAGGECVPLRCFDKTRMNAALPACEVEDLTRNALFFDGLPTRRRRRPGADRLTRLEQNADGFIRSTAAAVRSFATSSICPTSFPSDRPGPHVLPRLRRRAFRGPAH